MNFLCHLPSVPLFYRLGVGVITVLTLQNGNGREKTVSLTPAKSLDSQGLALMGVQLIGAGNNFVKKV